MNKLISQSRSLMLLCLMFLFAPKTILAQCFQIESILVAACAPQVNSQTQEGYNEMVRFKVGNAALNTSNMSVQWPNNRWQNLIKNTTTANKVAQLNANIQASGGCGQLLEPVNGVLPANATVILITSHLFDVASNSFGALNETYYIIFQNNNNITTGHFANYSSSAGTRTLRISFGSCSDQVTYDRTLLSPEIGATVNFTPNGTATYVNYGCSAPIPPFTVDAGNNPAAVCPGNSVTLAATAEGHTSVTWFATSGSFSAPNALNTTYTPAANATGTITLTLTATNVCGARITDTVIVTINVANVPDFDLPTLIICEGSAVPTLANTSPNGITGVWNPSIISNTNDGTYIFTPNNGQCASPFSLQVTVKPLPGNPVAQSPQFICSTAAVVFTLANISISGTNIQWYDNPMAAVTLPINTPLVNGATYYASQIIDGCESDRIPVQVFINQQTIPTFDFNSEITICYNGNVPQLPLTSNNGITGTWSASTIDNTNSASYTFTPNNGQCTSPFNLQVIVKPLPSEPVAQSPQFFCSAAAVVFTLANISINGTNIQWYDNAMATVTLPTNTPLANGATYYASQTIDGCESNRIAIQVFVNQQTTPTFDFNSEITICYGGNAPELPLTSNNGITGTWSDTVIDTTQNGSYTFTPQSNSCAQPTTLTVTIIQDISFTIDWACVNEQYVLQIINTPAYESITWQNESNENVSHNPDFNVSQYLAANPSAVLPLQFHTTITTSEGCSKTIPFVVESIYCGIQKGISPNGDNRNDAFDLSLLNVKHLSIFNRYGIKVYQKSDYKNEWLGQTDKGKELPTGTYYYVIDLANGDSKTGWIYINR